ncbi:MAG: hypothetical protein IKK83_04085 [Clostridia bacterium]|nr:hypothetical protein [Clostridia bacterium]
MKNDRQFIESIYEKKTARDREARKKLISVVAIALVMALVVGAIALMPSGGAPDVQGQDGYVADLPDKEDSTADSKAEDAVIEASTQDTDGEQSKAEQLLVLTRPDDRNEEEAYIDTPLTPNFALTGPIDDTRFYDTLKAEENTKARFAVALEIDSLSAFTYEGKTVDELFYDIEYGYRCFRDETYALFNEYQTAFVKWRWSHEEGGYNDIVKDLWVRAQAGDKEAEEMYIYYEKTSDKVIFRELVWDKTQSAEDIKTLEAQIAHYDAIWAVYRNEGENYLKEAYGKELERLLAEGYDLHCTTANGQLMLTGSLTAEQILYFDNTGNFSYRCSWLVRAPLKDADKIDLTTIIGSEADE